MFQTAGAEAANAIQVTNRGGSNQGTNFGLEISKIIEGTGIENYFDITLTAETTSVKLLSEQGEGDFGINLDSVSLSPLEVDEPVVEPTEPGSEAASEENPDASQTPSEKPTEPTKPAATTPNSGSTNVEPAVDYTLALLIAVAVLIPIMAVVAILLAIKLRPKKD